MQNEEMIRQTETVNTRLTARKSPAFLAPGEGRAPHRKLYPGLDLPLRRACLTRRAMLAALRQAELAQWLASGGDFLRSRRPPIN